MKTRVLSCLAAFAFLSPFAHAETFPGLQSLLTPAEWERAGLARLTPDQVGVIDAALIRYQAKTSGQHQAELAAARTTAVEATPAAAPAPKGWLERFGLPTWDGPDWRTLPPLKAKVVAWEGANRFRLDNGQLWEGFEPITYDLPGKEIEIQARPNERFTLVVDGKNTTLRVMRLR